MSIVNAFPQWHLTLLVRVVPAIKVNVTEYSIFHLAFLLILYYFSDETNRLANRQCHECISVCNREKDKDLKKQMMGHT